MPEKNWDKKEIAAAELRGFIQKHGKPLHTQTLGNRQIAVFYPEGHLQETEEAEGDQGDEVPTNRPDENPVSPQEVKEMKDSVEYQEPTAAEEAATEAAEIEEAAETEEEEESENLPEDPEVRHTLKTAGLLNESAVRSYYDEHGNLTSLKGVGPVTEKKIKDYYGIE